MRPTNSSLHLGLPSSRSDNVTDVVDIAAIFDNVKFILYALMIVLGTTGNAVVIWVAGFKLRPNVTNVWLVNLAVADFIFCFSRILSLTKKLFQYWPFGLFLCKFNGFFKYANMFCSVFLLAVISLDRVLCVWRPILAKRRRTLTAARLVSAGVWVAAIVMSSPDFAYRQLYIGKNNLSKCSFEVKEAKEGDNATKMSLYCIRFLCGFLLPFLVILCCYVLTAIGIRRTRLSGKSRPLRILVALVCAFFLCWAPYHVLLLVKMVDRKNKAVKIALTLASSVAYFNSCVNPLLYFCIGLTVRGKFRQSVAAVYRRALTEDVDGHSTQTKDNSTASGPHPSLVVGGGGGGGVQVPLNMAKV